jgi:hypothetical protein
VRQAQVQNQARFGVRWGLGSRHRTCAGDDVLSMTVCRTLDEVLAAADADSKSDPPLSQDQADLIAAILAAGEVRRESE